VVLLEKGTLASEASSLAAGTVHVIGPGPDLDAHLSNGTREIVLGLEAKYNVDPELTECSALCIATTI
jgi:glycine/D-amino acid oxidase-like deaminating enzyme